MNELRTKKRLFACIFLLLSGALFVFFGVAARRAQCAVYCSPVIAVTNYQQFSELLKNLVKNFLIAQLKAAMSQKFSFAYKPGSFVSAANGSLTGVTDFSSMITGTATRGLNSEIGYVNSRMNAATFTSLIDKAELTALNQELKQQGLDKKEIEPVLAAYQKALNSTGIVGTYSSEVNEYQSMVSDFMPVASNLLVQMTTFAGKMDVASAIQSSGTDITGNTRRTLSECVAHVSDGLGVLGNIANFSIGDAINVKFSTANADYLKVRLGKITSGSGKALTSEDIDRIITKVNNAAAQSVPRYVTQSTNSLTSMASDTAAAVGGIMKPNIQSAVSAITKAAAAEKAQESAVKSLYVSMEKDVQGLIGNARSYETFARDTSQGSLFDDSSMKKIMVLLARRESSATLKKLAVKNYITARTSLEVAAVIKAQLAKFDPAAIDGGYEDQAWKDLARFHYYLLYLENQKLKLMAIRAMVRAVDTDDPDVLKYVEKSGLPAVKE